MGCHAPAQCIQGISAFQQGDDTIFGVSLRDLHDSRRNPGIISLAQIQFCHIVLAMGVEAGRDKQHLRFESLQLRYPLVLDRLAKIGADTVPPAAPGV